MLETISIHKAITYSKSKGVVIESEHHNKILCQSSEMLAFKSMQRMHLLEAFLFLQKSREFAPSLKQRERSRGSLTVGPEGPLVRFDRFFPPSPLFCPTGAGLRRSPSTNGSSSRASKGGDGTARPRRSFGWLMGRRRWKESPAASSAAEKIYGGEVTLVLRWSPIEVE